MVVPTARSRLRQKNREGTPGGGGAGGHPKLGVKICGMLFHGVRGSAQDDGDFRVRLAFGDPVKHFRFAGRQPQGQKRFGTLINKSVFDPHERQVAGRRKRVMVDFDFPFFRMANQQGFVGIASELPGANLAGYMVFRLLGKHRLQNGTRLPRRKQYFSADIGDQKRLIERILQEFAHSMLKWESGGADGKGYCLHRFCFSKLLAASVR